MPAFTTDFSEYTNLAQPDDWTLQWDSISGDFKALLPYAAPNEMAVLGLYETSNTQNALSCDSAGSVADIDQVAIFKGNFTTTVRCGLVARGSGTAGTESGYVGWLEYYSGVCNLRILKYLSGSGSYVGTISDIPLLADIWYCLRFQVIGTSLKLKYWLASEEEPIAWDLSETNSDITAAGWAGIFGNENMGYCDYYSSGDSGGEPDIPIANYEYSDNFSSYADEYQFTSSSSMLYWKQEWYGDSWQYVWTVHSATDSYVQFDGNITGGGDYIYLLSTKLLGTPTDGEIEAVFSSDYFSSGVEVILFLRLSEEDYNAIGCRITSDSISFGVVEYYSASTITSSSIVVADSTKYRAKFRAIGTNLYAKIWEDGTTEPSSWDIATTDSTCEIGICGIGVNGYQAVEFYDVNIKTGTETYLISAGTIELDVTLPELRIHHENVYAYPAIDNVLWSWLPDLRLDADIEFIFLDVDAILPDLQIEAYGDLRGIEADSILPELRIEAKFGERLDLDVKILILRL